MRLHTFETKPFNT